MHMTKIFQGYRRFLQTPNGNVSHFIQENMVEVVLNKSEPLIPILCRPAHNFHPNGIYIGDNPLRYSFSQFMFNLILFTAITRSIRFLLKPLKQPQVISQIIGGVVVGPSFLGRSKWFQDNVLTESSQHLMNNFGIMGFMFFLFIYGIKMDTALLRKSGKMHVHIAVISIIIPITAVFITAMCMRKNMDKELAMISSIGVLVGYLAITSFPDIYHILDEFNLLNSDVGRIALSSALVGDVIGTIFLLTFEAASQGEAKAENVVWYLTSLLVFSLFMVFCVRPAVIWINEKTPEGHQADSSYVIAILLGVFVMGFLTDFLGVAIANGPLWLGLVIPDGPRLGATVIEKSRTIMAELFLPFSYYLVGSCTDFYAMSASGWSTLSPLFFMVLVGYLTKFFSTWIAAFYWQMPLRDGITLSLIMSLRGQTEVILFVHFLDKKVLKIPGFSFLVLMTIALTAAFTPLISKLYDPTRPYMVNQRRNIQHNPPDKDLKIVLCIIDSDIDTIDGLIGLLDITNATTGSSFLSVCAVRLIELVGRAHPLFVDHEEQDVPHIYRWTHMINTLEHYEQHEEVFVKFRFFTAVAPKLSMFQDVCELALYQKSSLIIIPFNKEGVHDHAVKTINLQVLNHSPCSVAIFVDKGLQTRVRNSFHPSTRRLIALLFLGGADAREALVYADRMVANQDVFLRVIRFLSYNNIGDSEMEKKLDDGIVTWFWVKNEINQRVMYREVVVKNGEETIAAIQALNDGSHYDLFIVGRKQGINPVLVTGFTEWNECEELGPVGDYVSSEDFFCSVSVLVVQQQILRG